MPIREKIDNFFKKQFMGENKKVEENDKTKEASAIDRAHRMLQMPEEIDKLQENLKKIFKEISISIKDIETKNKNYEYEIEYFHKRIAVLEKEKEVEVLKHQKEGQ